MISVQDLPYAPFSISDDSNDPISPTSLGGFAKNTTHLEACHSRHFPYSGARKWLVVASLQQYLWSVQRLCS